MEENSSAEQTGAEGGEVRRGLIGMVRANDVHLEQSASAVTTARGGAELHQSASVAVVSGKDTALTMAAAVVVPTLGDVHIDKGAAQWVVAAGDVSIDKGGCVAAVAPSVRVDHGAAGVVLARHAEIGEGSRVLFGPLAAGVLGLGLGIGMGLAFFASLGYAGKQAWQHRPQRPGRG